MTTATPAMIRRQDYCAPSYWIRQVDLVFDLDPTKTIVSSKLEIERNPAYGPNEPLCLHGESLNLLRVLVNGQSVSFRNENNVLVIENLPATELGQTLKLEIRNTIAPEKNTELSGLYTSGGGFFTQCEAQGFRRITYFLDRPDIMATYTVTLKADKVRYPVLLSNGNLVEEGVLEDGRHFARWHDPHPKPCYLFALVAADLVSRAQRIRTRSGSEHLLQIYVRRGDLEKTEHAMQSLMASIIWDEARFGLKLDLERYMIVAVSDFNMGAMENKGLNLFNTKFVLANAATATDQDFANIESVVAHEYFHNWTGNRVTCRDWFQLSLKEGLTVFRDQEFSQDMAATPSARAVKRIEDVRQLRALQFPEDAGPMAHPVRPDQYQAIDNFYTATVYEKGAEVVRMMQTLVGKEGFARGLRAYFDRHDGQAVTCDDFLESMVRANPNSLLASLKSSFALWYSQSGTPLLRARGVYDAENQRYTLTLEQTIPAQPQGGAAAPMVIPVVMGLLGRDGQPIPLQLESDGIQASSNSGVHFTRLLVLPTQSAFVTFVHVAHEPVPSLLRGFSAPVLLDDGLKTDDRLILLAHDSDPFNRWEAAQRLLLESLVASVLAGEFIPAPDALMGALQKVLRDSDLDPAFKELVLTLPSEGAVAENLAELDGASFGDATYRGIDPQLIHAMREALRLQLAQSLSNDWQWAWQTHQTQQGYEPTAYQSGCRSLANLALSMLVLASVHQGDAVWSGRAYQRVKDATNMTDRLGALAALVESHADLADRGLAYFYELFAQEPLAIDKWFSLQARAPEKEGRVFQRIKALMQHPAYSARNPNRARSLLFSMCMFNPAAFHRTDAAGYVFWAERVLELDAINPQLAARLARAMDRWQQLAQPWRSGAHQALLRIAERPQLSPDVREVITRALNSALNGATPQELAA